MSSTSSSVHSQKRWVKKGKKSILCSTPVEESNMPRNISISTIEANSSSSLMTRRPLRQPAKVEKKQKTAKAKEQKPAKKKKTKARKNRKKTRPKNLADTDSDWLTTLEQTDDEKENLKQSVRSSTKELALFYDTASPERVREPQQFHDYHFDSPVHKPRNYVASPIFVNLGDNEKSLPVKDLPQLQTRFDSSDEEEHDLVLTNTNQPRTYPGVRHRRKTKREISIDKSKRWLVSLKIPMTAADILWDEYVRTHPEEMREWVAPRAKTQEVLSSSDNFSSKKQNKGDKGKAAREDNVENRATKKLDIISRDVPPDRSAICGYREKTSGKWFRKSIDPFSESEDSNSERFKTGAPKTRLNKYREKRKVQKDFDSEAAGPSCSKVERIDKQNVKDTKTKQKEKLQARKPVAVDFLSDSSSDSETANRTVARTLTTELQRFHNLRSYATRLKAKEREMMSKNVIEDSDKRSLVPSKRKTRKRANEFDGDELKRTKMVDESRPFIKSDQVLVHKKYVKEKDHWRIV